MLRVKDVNKNIGKNVKALRISRGITQEQLAEAIGLERKSITAIETGRTFISCEVLVNLSNYFNVEPAFFFKPNYVESTEDEISLQKDIIRMLTDCNKKMLITIYNFVINLKSFIS